MEGFKSDVFVTYSSKDFGWVDEQLLPLFDEQKVDYTIHIRDFELGKPIVENMADSIYGSRKILVILSKNYITSRFCMEELEMALRRKKDGTDKPIIAVCQEKLSRSEIPKDLRGITFLDYTDQEERQFWKGRLMREICAGRTRHETGQWDL